MIGQGQNITFLKGREDIRDFIRASDIVMTFFSNSGLLALIADKPLICVELEASDNKNFYEKFNLAPVAKSADDLKKLLILKSTNGTPHQIAKQALEEMVDFTDGQAAARVAHVVVEMLK